MGDDDFGPLSAQRTRDQRPCDWTVSGFVAKGVREKKESGKLARLGTRAWASGRRRRA
jgi:hypothetical protein